MGGRRGTDNMAVVLQMVQQNDEKHEAGHARLRGDWRGHDARILSMESAIADLRLKVERTADKPADFSTATLPVRLVAPIVVAGLLAAGAMWRIGSQVNDVANQMTNRNRLDDERHESYKAALEDLKREVKMYEIKTDEVQKALIAKGVIR